MPITSENLYLKASAFVAMTALTGCTSFNAGMQSLNFPEDTPLLINDKPYQINKSKCATIKAVNASGDLECYDEAGERSADIPQVSEFRRELVEKRLKAPWGSPEHFAFLYNFHYQGGKEKAAGSIMGGMQSLTQLAATVKMWDKVGRMPEEEAKLKLEGSTAYYRGGFKGWSDHQTKMTNWYAGNAKFFTDNMVLKCNPVICPVGVPD